MASIFTARPNIFPSGCGLVVSLIKKQRTHYPWPSLQTTRLSCQKISVYEGGEHPVRRPHKAFYSLPFFHPFVNYKVTTTALLCHFSPFPQALFHAPSLKATKTVCFTPKISSSSLPSPLHYFVYSHQLYTFCICFICLLHKPFCLFSHYAHQLISPPIPILTACPRPLPPKGPITSPTHPPIPLPATCPRSLPPKGLIISPIHPPCHLPITCPRPPAPKKADYLTYPSSYSTLPHPHPQAASLYNFYIIIQFVSFMLPYPPSYPSPHNLSTSPAPKRADYLTYPTSYSALPHPHPQTASLYNFYIIIQSVSFMPPYPLLLSPSIQVPFPPPLPSFSRCSCCRLHTILPYFPSFPAFPCPIRPLAQSIPYNSMHFILIIPAFPYASLQPSCHPLLIRPLAQSTSYNSMHFILTIPAFLCASLQPAERPPAPTEFPNKLLLLPFAHSPLFSLFSCHPLPNPAPFTIHSV